MKESKSYLKKIEEAASFLKNKLPKLRYALLLGTGTQKIASTLKNQRSIAYTDVPYFLPTTSLSHKSQLQVGLLRDVPLLLLEGRYHYYEGYSMQEITFPIRVMAKIGIDTLLLTCAVGGLRPGMQKSELILIRDHINLQPENPLRGQNLDTLGPRFPDMSTPYDKDLRQIALTVSKKQRISLQEGVYVAVQGPQLETPSEYNYLRQIGADVVGMSTAPEVIVARHMGLRCCAIAVVSDLCYPDALEEIDVQKVLAAVEAAQPNLETLLCGILKEEQSKKDR